MGGCVVGMNYAVIVAGGKGTRMGTDISKQFLELQEKPVIYHTIKVFEKCNDIDGIYLVLSYDGKVYFEENILTKYSFLKLKEIVIGGEVRQQSVFNGLKAIKECDVVIIHDGARPFVTEENIKKSIEYAKMYGGSASGVIPKDTIKVKTDKNLSKETLDRNTLIAVQTPQSFIYSKLIKAHEYVFNNNISVTDDTAVFELMGHQVYLYEGEYTNLKITTPEDLVIGEYLINNLQKLLWKTQEFLFWILKCAQTFCKVAI